MEDITFTNIVKFFFQFGPFAILPYLMLFALPRLYKQMKTTSKDLKPILKRNIVIYQILIIFLIIFCIGFWTFSSTSTGATDYFYGEIVNLNAADRIESRNLYLRKYISYDEYVVDWIWKKTKDETYASIKLIGKDPFNPDKEIKKEFQLNPQELKISEKISLNYKDGALTLNGTPLKIAVMPTRETRRENKVKYEAGNLLYAAPQEDNRFIVEKIINLLQAYDSGIRDQAVDIAIQTAEKNNEPVKKLLKAGFEIIRNQTQQNKSNRLNKDLFTGLMRIIDRLSDKWKIGFNEWKEIIGPEAIALIKEESKSENSDIQNLCFRFLSRFKNEAIPQNLGVRETTAHNTVSNENGINLESIIGKQKQVIIEALALKKKNIPFKFGGKNLEKGMDSSGFIAYIFNKAGILDNPDKWWSGMLRDMAGAPRKEKIPIEAGDLVFYNDGYVMVYVGDKKVIGMTPIGIIIIDYALFPVKLLQVNRVDYNKRYSPNLL